jgi:molecular chaperone GrpE (heat shock protein)
MDYSVANEKYKKYEYLLTKDPKNRLFKRKLGKYDTLRQSQSLSGGQKRERVKGYRTMRGGAQTDFASNPAKIPNKILEGKDQIIAENNSTVEAVKDKIENVPNCETDKSKVSELAQQLEEKTKQLVKLQAAFDQLNGVDVPKQCEEKLAELNNKVKAELDNLRTEVAKLTADKDALQKIADAYVQKITTESKTTIDGLEEIINNYQASMEKIREELSISK